MLCMLYNSAGRRENIITRVLLGKLPTNSLSYVTYLFIIYLRDNLLLDSAVCFTASVEVFERYFPRSLPACEQD